MVRSTLAKLRKTGRQRPPRKARTIVRTGLLAVTSVNSLLCQASTCFSHGLEIPLHSITPSEMQSMRENDFECFASTGVKTPQMAKTTDNEPKGE